jgi:hypothetical protein
MGNRTEKLPFDVLIHLMLDGEATEQEKKDFNQYIAQSFYYSDKFEQEKQVRQSIKTKMTRLSAPKDLINSLQSFMAHQNMAALNLEECESPEEELFQKVKLKN